MKTPQRFSKTLLSTAIATSFTLTTSFVAIASAETYEEIVVTATRRSASVQDIPLNIAALPGAEIEKLGLTDLADLARTVPGMTVVDHGGREIGNNIIVRGLNTGPVGPGMSDLYKTSVATYLGEIPVFVDLKPIDLNRVEVLIGPQGTLYGAGTLAGAVRYIANKPSHEFEASVWGDVSQFSEADDMSYHGGVTLNIPISNILALRASVQQFEDSGYIDYNYITRESGVSLAQPDFNNPAERAQNTRRKADANGEETLTARIAARLRPTETIDATLSYWHQDQEVEGRSISHKDTLQGIVDVGDYESALRFEEPNDLENDLLSLEVEADLGFATLNSATGRSRFTQLGQRDQTDLLLDFQYGYEDFPSFSSFTREDREDSSLTQELRLVSNADSPLQWIAGVYYSQYESESTSREFTPNYDEFLAGVNLRTDDLEYLSYGDEELTEVSFFGELSYSLGDVTMTVGARDYDYDNQLIQGFDLPLAATVFGGRADGSIDLPLEKVRVEDSGSLFKFNVSWQLNDDMMTYFTASEGYRIGGLNGIAACTGSETGNDQNLCALPDEFAYTADTTLNKELGLKSQWLDGALTFNTALFHIDWDDVQVPGRTQNGNLPITVNGGKAISSGVEANIIWQATEALQLSANYAHSTAKLDEDAPELVRTDDAFSGDPLPGSPDETFVLALDYSTELLGLSLNANYLYSYIGEVYTTVGGRGNSDVTVNAIGETLNNGWGEVLPSFSLHNMSLTLSDDNWEAGFYIDNIFDEYAITSVRGDRSLIRDVSGVRMRAYGRYVAPPQNVGLRFRVNF